MSAVPEDVRLDHPAITILGPDDHTTVTCLCGWRSPATTRHAARARHLEHQQAITATDAQVVGDAHRTHLVANVDAPHAHPIPSARSNPGAPR